MGTSISVRGGKEGREWSGSMEQRKEERGVGMRLLGIAINRAEACGKLALTRNRLGVAMSALATDY